MPYRSFWSPPPIQNTARRYSPCSPGTEVVQLIDTKMPYQSFEPPPLDHNTASRYSPCSPGTKFVRLIDKKTLYWSFGPPTLDHRTARRYSPCSPGTEVVEVIPLSHDLISSLLSYCDDVTIGIFWLVRKLMRVLVL